MTTISTLKNACIRCDIVSRKKDGTYIFRRGYFYRHGMDSTKFANQVSEDLTEHGIAHEIVSRGDNFTAFRGGAPLQKQSHFWVTVKLT